MTRDHAFNILRRVRDELDSGRFAIGHVLSQWNSDPNIVGAAKRGGYTESELRRCAANLEMTFVLRLFSEFEGTLRDYWRNGLKRNTEPMMFDLMESIGHRRDMSQEDLALAHQIREYRNELIHENLGNPMFDFPACLRGLGRYLRWFPSSW